MGLKRDSLDAAFSDYIRWRNQWTCQRCGKKYAPPTNALHCAHIYGRSSKGLRCHENNALALCHGCHAYFTGQPIVFYDWLEHKFGKPYVDQLRYLYHTKTTFNRSEKKLLKEHFRRNIVSMKKSTIL